MNISAKSLFVLTWGKEGNLASPIAMQATKSFVNARQKKDAEKGVGTGLGNPIPEPPAWNQDKERDHPDGCNHTRKLEFTHARSPP
ncbi:hypothetical protein GWG65_29265 [Bradyrhizobium sp. CSA207]|uniref:hypothetical protein n=1 Tax=Bradyrhizobium sp. CSA207 TaxID=2698826 RepID=UPI0023B04CC3|nr:hypothetical protein [Bradyrhizobium sp. CSA207]MDE5445449.1 hypothetical protein [Bradyrhizobium sp. CSA207]